MERGLVRTSSPEGPKGEQCAERPLCILPTLHGTFGKCANSCVFVYETKEQVCVCLGEVPRKEGTSVGCGHITSALCRAEWSVDRGGREGREVTTETAITARLLLPRE